MAQGVNGGPPRFSERMRICPPRPGKKRGLAKRNLLLQAARTQFAEQGYQATSITDITSRAGGPGARLPWATPAWLKWQPPSNSRPRLMDRPFGSLLARSASLSARDFDREVRIAADVIYHYPFHDPYSAAPGRAKI